MPERVFGLQVRCRELDIFKIWFFLRNCLQIFWIYSGFWGKFFGRISLFILLKSAKELLLLSRFCLKEEGGGQEFRSLEVRRKLIALKKNPFKSVALHTTRGVSSLRSGIQHLYILILCTPWGTYHWHRFDSTFFKLSLDS